jgi:hypothetical protein
MKIKIDIDCTPAEARSFLGLPEVAPLQAEMMAAVQERMMKALAGMDPEALMKMWLPAGAQGFEQMQKAFWEQFAGGGRKGGAT